MKRCMMFAILIGMMGFYASAQTQEVKGKQNTHKSNDISFDDILFWVGEGSHEAMFIVNWCSPDIAFAWGYRFNDDSITVSDMMQDIAAADSRIHFTDGGGYITEIMYNDSNYHLALTGDYWMYNVNEGFTGGIDDQYIHNTDVVEFGDESCGISDTNWIYTWDISITPVSLPNSDVSIQALNENNIHIQVYPNPCSEMITIQMSGVSEMITLSMTDISGRIVYTENVSVSGSEKRVIAVNKLQRGVYFIRFQGTELNKATKLIVY